MPDHTIVIPPNCKHTEALRAQVDPPHAFMSISMTFPGESGPFREGKLIGRRCPEIAAFLFRPGILDTKTRKRAAPLQKKDKIKIKVTLYKKGDPTKKTLSEPFQTEEAVVEVT